MLRFSTAHDSRLKTFARRLGGSREGPSHAALLRRAARRASGRPPLLEVRELPEDRVLQAARRLEQGPVAVESEKARGLVTVSAGNHAQAVAWAARMAGAACAVVMPSSAPRSRSTAGQGLRRRGDPARRPRHALRQVERGPGSARPDLRPSVRRCRSSWRARARPGSRSWRTFPDVDVVVVPVGGEGCSAAWPRPSSSSGRQRRSSRSSSRKGRASLRRSRRASPVPVPRPPDTLADGMTPPFVGALPLQIAREAVDEIVAVGERRDHRGNEAPDDAREALRRGLRRRRDGRHPDRQGEDSGRRAASPRSSPGGNVDLERIAALSPSRAAADHDVRTKRPWRRPTSPSTGRSRRGTSPRWSRSGCTTSPRRCVHPGGTG